jgi:hypothetical protein
VKHKVDSIVVCNACTREIRFPTTTPSQRVMNQMSSTPIEIPRNILCPHCKRVLLYEAPEFYPSGVENTDPNLSPGDWVRVCIAVSCAQEDCESHVQLHSIMLESNSMKKEAAGILSSSIFVKARCEKGHWQNRLNQNDCEVYAVRA